MRIQYCVDASLWLGSLKATGAWQRAARIVGRNTTSTFLVVPLRHRRRHTHRGIGHCTGECAYVEHILALSLVAGQIVVLDNLSVHKGARVRELIEAKGCELLFLPAYSPDLSPIEETKSCAQSGSPDGLAPGPMKCVGRPLDKPWRR